MEFYLKSVDIKCWDVVINGFDMVDKASNSRATHILYSHLNDNQYSLISHCLTAQEIWTALTTRYGNDSNFSKPSTVNSDSDLCSTDESADEDSTDDEIRNFSYEDLVYFCVDLTKSVDKLQSKNKSLKSINSELTNKMNCLESKLSNIVKFENPNCENCLK